MTKVLNSTRIVAPGATPDRWLVVLHGIYGMGRNWASIARRVAEARPEWGILLVDLRLHGGSGGFEGPHTIAAAAADVHVLVTRENLPVATVLGHSYGGKVALAYARAHGEGLEQVWVIDSALEVRDPSGTAWGVIDAVRKLPEVFPTREALAQGLMEHGYDAPLAAWLGMNLERGPAGLTWKLDWEGVEEMLRDYFRTDVWDVVENPPPGAEVHVVSAGESDSVSEADAARIRAAPRAVLHEVVGGHWIHVDNPEAVVNLLVEEL